ncbi:hypothetical protein A2U01_0110046, partial [Trifolium medium]|nr:hypothetical protein [Trifolium medium]
AGFVIRIAEPRLIITRRQVRNGEEIWDEENHMAEVVGDRMKVVVVVAEEEV